MDQKAPGLVRAPYLSAARHEFLSAVKKVPKCSAREYLSAVP